VAYGKKREVLTQNIHFHKIIIKVTRNAVKLLILKGTFELGFNVFLFFLSWNLHSSLEANFLAILKTLSQVIFTKN
jgi:hypothetical protein